MSPNHVAYVRVSSASQDYDSQLRALVCAVKASGERFAHVYTEKASGKSLLRPELKKVLDTARMGQIGHLWIFKLDRLTRSGVGDTFRVVDELRHAGVTLHALADNLVVRPSDHGDLVSDTLLFALSLAARLERLAIHERQAAARARMQAEGRSWGRPHRMGKPELARALELADAGESVRKIAQRLHVPQATVSRSLRRVRSAS